MDIEYVFIHAGSPHFLMTHGFLTNRAFLFLFIAVGRASSRGGGFSFRQAERSRRLAVDFDTTLMGNGESFRRTRTCAAHLFKCRYRFYVLRLVLELANVSLLFIFNSLRFPFNLIDLCVLQLQHRGF